MARWVENKWLWGAALLIIAPTIIWRRQLIVGATDTTADLIEEIAQVTGGGARGIRNNNPGNIRKGQSWQGERVSQLDDQFEEFENPEYGYRALCKIIDNYRKWYSAKTIRAIINRYAPPSDNNPTNEYVVFVAEHLGVGPDDYIDTTDPETMADICDAITRFENGGANTFSRDVIAAGIALARSGGTFA